MDITVSMPNQAAQRLATACGKMLGLIDEQGQSRAATVAEVKSLILAPYLKNIIINYERDTTAIPAVDIT